MFLFHMELIFPKRLLVDWRKLLAKLKGPTCANMLRDCMRKQKRVIIMYFSYHDCTLFYIHLQ